MECNKDEAIRAKDIAERKFAASDISGAKNFALKARNLNSGLAGIAQMLATLEVYVSAENKINGEVDWYGVLGVSSQSDVDTMRKQYKKLALMVHPDKNSFIGADGAFKLISKAWTLLSDNDQRVAFDRRRNTKKISKPRRAPVRRSSASSGANRTNGPASSPASIPKTRKCPTEADHSSTSASASKPKTLHTECYHCKMQHEVSLAHRYQIINCPSCRKPFLARERETPATGSKTSIPRNFSQQNSSSNQEASKNTSNAGRNCKSSSNAEATKSKSPDSRAYIFWTLCDNCKMHHKFLRVYANRKIRCPCCHKPFLARETTAHSNGSKTSTSDSFSQQKNLDNQRVSKSAPNADAEARKFTDDRKPDSKSLHNSTVSTPAYEESVLKQTSKKVKI